MARLQRPYSGLEMRLPSRRVSRAERRPMTAGVRTRSCSACTHGIDRTVSPSSMSWTAGLSWESKVRLLNLLGVSATEDRSYKWRLRDTSCSADAAPSTLQTHDHSNTKQSATTTRTARRERYQERKQKHLTAEPPDTARVPIEKSNKKPSPSKYVPYSAAAFRDLQHQKNESRPESRVDHSHGNNLTTKLDMSVTELPPINNRPSSSKSIRSSRGSSSGGPVRNSIMRHEKPQLITADHNTLMDNGAGMMTSRTTTKRSHFSPKSNGSSSPSQQGSFPSTQASGVLSRAKSWCATEANSGPNPKLETLCELNGVIKPEPSRRHSGESSTEGTKNDNVMTKPPRGRLRSQGAAGSSQSPLQTMKRSLSNSVSNLSRQSDTKDTIISNNTKPLRNGVHPNLGSRTRSNLHSSQKFKSETNLSSYNAGFVTSRTERNNQRNKFPPTSQGNRQNNNVTQGRTMPKLTSVRSQPVINNHKNNANEGRLTTQTLKIIAKQTESEAEGSDSDSDKNERIVQWLMAVDGGCERPHTPVIMEDNPPQTDTAIHIVYDKD